MCRSFFQKGTCTRVELFEAFPKDANYVPLLPFQFTPTEAYVSISCKIAGVRLTTCRLFSPQSRSVIGMSCSYIQRLDISNDVDDRKQLSLFFVISARFSLQSLLDEPNPNSPANSQAAQLYQENKREYEKRVSAIVEQSWRDS